MHAAAKMGIATVAFAVVHSALATRRAKCIAATAVGERRRDAGYRIVYVGQSLLMFSLLTAYALRLPRHTVYRAEGGTALLLRLGQAAGVVHLLAALRQIGIARWSGWENLRAWRNGGPMPPGPFAQGPESQATGELSVGGPFRRSRHPLNFSPLPMFWLTPHMTSRRLAFNLVSSAYFVLGSLHEKARLKAGYGLAYDAYVDSGVPFYVPRLRLKLPGA